MTPSDEESAMAASNVDCRDFTGCRYNAEHEVVQPRGDHESHNDSVYFNFAAPPDCGIVGGVVRIGLRPNEGYSEASLVMPRRDGGVVFHYKRSPLTADDHPAGASEWNSGAMTLAATDATRRWRLTYAGDEARLVADPRAFGDDPGGTWRSSESLRCGFDFEWNADFPVHVLSPEGDLMPGDDEIAYGKNHYEQFGQVSGDLRLGDETWTLKAAPAFRDHSWGPRIWESAPNQDFVTAYLDDGRRIVAVANRTDAGETMHGVLFAPGDIRPTQLDGYELRTSYAGEAEAHGPIGWRFEAGGQTVEVEGEVEGFMPLRVGKDAVRIGQTLIALSSANPGYAKTDLTRPIART
jgi:hypothetical protein